MDAVIYAAQISSSFFSSLAIAVEGFLDLFIDSNSDNSGNDDDTSLNSRSLTLGGGEKRIPSGALSAIVLWCDSELVYVYQYLMCCDYGPFGAVLNLHFILYTFLAVNLRMSSEVRACWEALHSHLLEFEDKTLRKGQKCPLQRNAR